MVPSPRVASWKHTECPWLPETSTIKVLKRIHFIYLTSILNTSKPVANLCDLWQSECTNSNKDHMTCDSDRSPHSNLGKVDMGSICRALIPFARWPELEIHMRRPRAHLYRASKMPSSKLHRFLRGLVRIRWHVDEAVMTAFSTLCVNGPQLAGLAPSWFEKGKILIVSRVLKGLKNDTSKTNGCIGEKTTPKTTLFVTPFFLKKSAPM